MDKTGVLRVAISAGVFCVLMAVFFVLVRFGLAFALRPLESLMRPSIVNALFWAAQAGVAVAAAVILLGKKRWALAAAAAVGWLISISFGPMD